MSGEQPVQGTVAYVLKGFPRLSETFIANEIHRLEALGVDLRLYSVKSGDAGLRHAVVGRIRAPLTRLPSTAGISERGLAGWLVENARPFIGPHLRLALRRPLAYFATAGRALAMCWRYRSGPLRPRKVYVKEFLQAGAIAADVLRRPEIAHVHGHFCHGATTITWFAAMLSGRPFSFTAHAKDIYQAKQNPGDLLARKLLAARFVATCTCANRDHLAKIAPAARIHTVYHGLDVALFRPRPAGDAGTAPPRILAVGRFVAKKGYPTLVEACALLAARGVPFRCAIVGEPGEDSATVAALVAERGLADRIELHGAMPQERLVDVYGAASVFVLPCQVMDDGDRDGIPNVLVEAMAMGMAVVSTAVSGIPELVEHERNGLLVPPRSVSALADAIARLVEQPAERARLGAAARATVLARFDSARTTRALAALYRASMRERRTRSAPEPAGVRP